MNLVKKRKWIQTNKTETKISFLFKIKFSKWLKQIVFKIKHYVNFIVFIGFRIKLNQTK